MRIRWYGLLSFVKQNTNTSVEKSEDAAFKIVLVN